MREFASHIEKSKNKTTVFFQPKLTINKPGDAYEQEADAMADKVMRMQDNSGGKLFFKPSNNLVISRKCSCHDEKEEISRKEMNNNEVMTGGEFENYIHKIESSGSPLSNESRSFFEPRFGYDFSDVRIHTDLAGSRSAERINALAYTTGSNIVFNSGQYDHSSPKGKRLLAHELTHVVQNKSTSDKTIRRAPAPKECDPDRELTWADYSGAIPRGATVGAITTSGIVPVTENDKKTFQGLFVPASSWALDKHKKAGDNSKNGCQQQITDCENFVSRNPRRLPGTTATQATGACPASIKPASKSFSSKADCTSVVGAECKRASIADANLLLAHEALHFKISCIIAKKANKDLLAGKDFDETGFKAADVLKKINLDNGSGQGDYDEETNHRCIKAKQDEWNTKVSRGLPGISIW